MEKEKKEDIKTIHNVSSKYGLKDEDILRQINQEYTEWYDAVVNKRKIRQEDIRLKYVPLATENKVNIHSIYTTVQTLMSVFYSDRMNVEFAARTKANIEQAANINLLAEFDYSEMKLEQLDYKWNWDRFFHWVGIKVIDWWDGVTKTPIAKIINPLCWIPDPRGWFTIDNHRWAGFEVEDTKFNMKARGYSNLELVNNKSSETQDEIRQAYKEGRNIITQYMESSPNAKYGLYHHYCIINWNKYLVTTANHRNVILNINLIKPILAEEKANPMKICFPIALKYYSPVEWDPIWISVPDLLKDKQSSESKLFNLTLITATRNALWDDKVYNPKKIKNVADLQKPTEGGKYIAANINENETLGSVIMTVPKENPWSLPFNVQEQLRFQSSISTGMDSNTLGIQAGWNQTATEAQITQKNANLRFVLWTKVGKWGEDSFWKLWYRSYAFNLKPKDKKAIRIQNWFNTKYYELGRKDFITKENVDIKIISKSEKESLQNKQKADFYAIMPQYLQDPTTPEIAKAYMKRKALRLANMAEDEVMRIVPKSVDESVALLDVELIDAWEEASEILDGQDHLTFIDILATAEDNKQRAEAVQKRQTAYIESWQKALWQIEGEDNTAGNIAQSNASSRMSANMIRETQAENTPSLDNV